MPAAKKTKIHAVDDLVGCNKCDGPRLPRSQMQDGLCPNCVEYFAEQETTKPEADFVELVSIPFRGHQFTIPKQMDEWLTEACLAMAPSTRDYMTAANILLGKGQWKLLLSLGNKRKDINEFLGVFADVVTEQCEN